ncbi:hypothetical protein [Chitinophaga defluvii]|uniref:Ig-like domain-containing protein n=1 Tax=Chitinophaga defluvii TaxID=3163343 RepID=A0ABV2T1M2_9BACT
MKKLLLSAAVLFFFGASVILTTMSYQKEAKAESPIVYAPLTLYTKDVRGQSSEIWLIANNDITKQQKINITLPAGQLIAPQAKLDRDASRVVFVTMDANEKETGIYSCTITGSDVRKIADAPTGTNNGITLQDAY